MLGTRVLSSRRESRSFTETTFLFSRRAWGAGSYRAPRVGKPTCLSLCRIPTPWDAESRATHRRTSRSPRKFVLVGPARVAGASRVDDALQAPPLVVPRPPALDHPLPLDM